MTNKKNSAVAAQNLTELQKQAGLLEASKIQVTFKQNKITASCRCHGYTYGSRGLSLNEALANLVCHVQAGVTGYLPSPV
jgi:hypothetical protein